MSMQSERKKVDKILNQIYSMLGGGWSSTIQWNTRRRIWEWEVRKNSFKIKNADNVRYKYQISIEYSPHQYFTYYGNDIKEGIRDVKRRFNIYIVEYELLVNKWQKIYAALPTI